MRSFRQIVLVSLVSMASVGTVYGQGDPTTKIATPYSEAIKSCGASWKASEERKADKSAATWQAYRAKCVVEQGWQAKGKRPK